MTPKIKYSDELKDDIFAFFFNSKMLINKLTSDNNELVPMYLSENIETISSSEIIAYLDKQEYKALRNIAKRIEGQEKTYQKAIDEVNNFYKVKNQ
jgi:hypothetical protein